MGHGFEVRRMDRASLRLSIAVTLLVAVTRGCGSGAVGGQGDDAGDAGDDASTGNDAGDACIFPCGYDAGGNLEAGPPPAPCPTRPPGGAFCSPLGQVCEY